MPTVQELINSSLRMIGVLDSGETPTSTESNDALAAINQLVSNWSSAGVPIYTVARDVIPMTGAASYAVPAPRPVKLKSAQVTNSGVSMPAEIVTSEIWVQVKDRSATSKFAQQLFYDGAYPSATVSLWPAPVTGSSLELFSLKPLAAFASLAATIDLPPGYEHALRCALASVLAPEYGRALPPEVAAAAAEAKTSIGSLNAQVLGPPLPTSGPAAAAPAA